MLHYNISKPALMPQSRPILPVRASGRLIDVHYEIRGELTGRALELWALPASGNPIALGLVDAEAGAVLTLATPSDALLAGAKGLAVSLEPPGGSPTGQPTGPILWTGAIVPI